MDWITTHEEDAVAKLPDYLRQPRLEAFIRVLARRYQKLEDALRSLQEGWWLSNAAGTQLDGFGDLLDEPRGALGDTEYKVRLQARIRLLRGNATPDELLGLLLLLNPTLRPRIVEEFPAALELHVSGGALPLVDVHLDLLRRARSGGVRLTLRYQYTDDANTFRLADAYSFLTAGASTGASSLMVADVRPFQTGIPSILVVDEGTPRQHVCTLNTATIVGSGPGGAITIVQELTTAVDTGAVVRLVTPGGCLDSTSPTPVVSTTLAVAMGDGEDVAAVASGAGLIPGAYLVLEPWTARQEILWLYELAGNDITFVGTTRYEHAAGATVSTLGALFLPGQLASAR